MTTAAARAARGWASWAYRAWVGSGATAPSTLLPADDLRRVMLGPLMYRGLTAEGDERAACFLPDYRHVMTANRYRLTHGATARDALEAAGLHVILIKGGAFLQRFGGRDPGIRPMSDLDLLVGAGEFEAAAEVMRGLQFEPATGRFPLSQRAAPARSFVKAQGAVGVDVDVHRALAQWPLAVELLRTVRQNVERVRGWSVPALPAAFCVTALHRARHGYLWPCLDLLDLKRTADALSDDGWDALIDMAVRCRVTGAAYAGFRQAVWWFGDDAVDVDRLRQLGERISRRRRGWLERMAPLDGPLAAAPVWNRPILRNLMVMPCVTGTPARAVLAAVTFLPLRFAEEWLQAPQQPGRPLDRATRLWIHSVWGADPTATAKNTGAAGSRRPPESEPRSARRGRWDGR